MEYLIPVLRLIHIVGAVFWAGGVLMLTGFILPTANALGPEGGRFMQTMVARGLPRAMTIASWSSVLAGLALFDFVSNHGDRAWLASPSGMVLTTGAVLGLLALGHGTAVQARNAKRLADLGRQVAAGGAPPTPEQAQRLAELRGRFERGARLLAILLLLATAAMAVQRYIG